jgi:protein involved in polysaccharide export with SLBB domain
MVLRFLFLACLISVPLLSLSQESGKEKSRVADTKPSAVASKTVIVYVAGDVLSPMGVRMGDSNPTTILKILEVAGGPNPTASLHKAKIIRKGENGRLEIPVDLTDILSGKAPDITLQADDILFVPRSSAKSSRKQIQIYDVPSSVPLRGPIYNR